MTEFFSQFKESIANIDPIYFIEKYLTLDGKPFRLNGNGYKPFSDVYRYIAIKALEPNGKPVVMVKGRQVGATTMAAALELYFMSCGLFGTASRPPMRIMHTFPQLELAAAYTKTKLNTMINTAIAFKDPTKPLDKLKSFISSKVDNASKTSDSLHFKQFENGNHIWIESLGIDGSRVRGRTVDMMFVDEVQDNRGIALANATKCLNKAQYGQSGEGTQVYFGTPKQKGSEYWNIWQKSSQQYYYLGCEKCEKHFPLYTPGSNEWENIWLYEYVVKCTHCGHEQDKRDAAEKGKWVASNPDPNSDLVGYHINQLYMPEFTKEQIIKQKPENHPINTERAYQNEVLGEFFAGDAAPITREEIDAICADHDRGMSARISTADNRRVYAGFDWGAKGDLDQLATGEKRLTQGQSYSCAVIITTEGPHLVNVEFATRLKKNDLQYKMDTVEEMFRRYAVSLAVGDVGFANDLTEQLQKEYGDQFLGSQAVGRVNGFYKFKTDFFPSTIMFEKDYLVADVYSMLKSGRIKLPYKNVNQIDWLINHICSMEIKTTVDRSGSTGIKYVKGSTPNDGLMALCNAVLAWKFDITDGFKIKNPNNVRDTENRKLPILVHYVPGLNPWKS